MRGPKHSPWIIDAGEQTVPMMRNVFSDRTFGRWKKFPTEIQRISKARIVIGEMQALSGSGPAA